MNFKQLIQTNSWLSVATIFLELYPQEEKNISGYKDVFEKLLLLNTDPSDISIVVANHKDDFDGEEYVDVSGKYENPKNQEEEYSQAIDFTAWSEWLGMEISPESLLNFTELEIIVHCLFEMTFVSFDEKEILREMKKMEASMEEYKNMTSDEKKANSKTLEELIEKYGEDLNSEN